MMQPDAAIIAAAADWAVELDAGEVAPARREACEAWCRLDPRHRLALDRMQALDTRLARLDGADRSALRGVLARRKPRNRRFGAVVGAALIVAAGLSTQSFAVREHFAGYETAVGEVRGIELADGSRLDLDTNGALDIAIEAERRRITLYRGQVFAEVAHVPGAPFVVESRHATATALGTAYVVRDEGSSTLVTVVESSVRLCAKHAEDDCVMLQAGERGRVAEGRVERLAAAIDPQAAAGWTGGWLEADDRLVAELLDELNRYRAQPATFDAAAMAKVRVTGAYPLADTDRALRSLAQSTGLRLTQQADGTVRLAP